MSSFYGGKQGRTYHIVERYDCVYLNIEDYQNESDIEQLKIGSRYQKNGSVFQVTSLDPFEEYQLKGMVNEFAKGGSYTKANYGEYVLIDTVFTTGKSNPQNGLLYRRGFDFLDEPATKPLKTDSQFNPDDIFDQEIYQAAWMNWVEKPGAGAIYVGQIVGPEGKVPQIKVEQWQDFIDQIEDEDRTGIGGYNQIYLLQTNTGRTDDDIKFGYINLIDDTTSDIIGGRIAIDIPKHVEEAHVIDHSPYLETGVEEHISSRNHPFWYNWSFTIQDGKHGQDLQELTVETGQDIINDDPDAEGLVNEDQYLTYSLRNYDQSAAGALSEHLGRWPYRVINEINLVAEQRTYFERISNNPVSLGNIIELNNNLYAICIKAGTAGSDISIFNNKTIGSQVQDGTVKWLVINLPAPAAASLDIDYTAGPNDTVGYQQIDHVFIDDTGKFYVVYTTDLNTPVYVTTIKSIESITINQDITQPQDIVANYQYGDSTIQEIIGSLNNILDIQRVGDSIIVLYSDPNVRKAIPELNQYRRTWGNYTKEKDDNTEGLIWYNFGPLGPNYHVFGSYSYDDIAVSSSKEDTTQPGEIAFGLGGEGTDTQNRQGWLITIPSQVTIQDPDNPGQYITAIEQKIYAYNYTQQTETGYRPNVEVTDKDGNTFTISTNWYEVMSLSNTFTSPNKYVAIGVEQTDSDVVELAEGGIWFKEVEAGQDGSWDN